MAQDEFSLISDDSIQSTLSDQIDIFLGLKKQARTLLRLTIAVFAVIIALLSVGISAISNADFEIREADYYFNQVVSNSGSEGEIAFALLLIFITGYFITAGSLMTILAGFLSISNVITTTGIYPYLSTNRESSVRLVTAKSESTYSAYEGKINRNNRQLSFMQNELGKGYTYLGYSFVLLVFGLLSIVSAYFAYLEIASVLAIVTVAAFISFLVPAIISKIIKYESRIAQRRIERMATIFELGGNVLIFTLILFLIFIPAAYSLFLLRGITVIIGVVILILALSIAIYGPLIHAEFRERTVGIIPLHIGARGLRTKGANNKDDDKRNGENRKDKNETQ